MGLPLAALDDGWLRGVLARAGADEGYPALVSARPIGDGNTAEVVRLILADGRTLIAKLPRPLPDGSPPPAELFGYDREVEAYRFFGPAPGFRIPRCIAAERDAEGFILILEDLGADARPGNQAAGCDTTDAGAVVAELASLHARFWRSPEVDALPWPSRRWHNADRTAALFDAGLPEMRARYGGHIGPAALDLIDAAAPLIRDWAAGTPFASTLIHADPRVDNVIFEAGGRACLIDLQSISIGDAAYDLAYFLTGSLEPEDRARCERELIAGHAAAIRAVDPAYDEATAWRRYRQFALSGLIATVSAAGVLRAGANVPQIAALARRNCAAIAALDGLEAARERIAEG